MNRESERKRLVELLKHECDVDGRYDGEGNCPGCKYNGMEDCSLQELADHLLNNGIVVPPVKVGQTVYCIIKGLEKPLEGFVGKVELYDLCSKFTVYIKGYLAQQYTDTSVGKTVFTSRKEAEKMLKGEEK